MCSKFAKRTVVSCFLFIQRIAKQTSLPLKSGVQSMDFSKTLPSSDSAQTPPVSAVTLPVSIVTSLASVFTPPAGTQTSPVNAISNLPNQLGPFLPDFVSHGGNFAHQPHDATPSRLTNPSISTIAKVGRDVSFAAKPLTETTSNEMNRSISVEEQRRLSRQNSNSVRVRQESCASTGDAVGSMFDYPSITDDGATVEDDELDNDDEWVVDVFDGGFDIASSKTCVRRMLSQERDDPPLQRPTIDECTNSKAVSYAGPSSHGIPTFRSGLPSHGSAIQAQTSGDDDVKTNIVSRTANGSRLPRVEASSRLRLPRAKMAGLQDHSALP